MKKTTATKKESKPMKLEVKKINTKQYETREEYNKAHKNDKKTEDKKKVKLAKKRSTAHTKKSNTYLKTHARQKQLEWSWRSIKMDDELVQNMHVLIWKPRIFNTPEEMQELFNSYLLSCMKKVRKAELIPVRTEIKEDDFLAELQDAAQANKSDWTKIDNTLITNYEIVEDIEWKVTPTKWGFCSFCWGISYQTFDNYKNREGYFETVIWIENTLESIWTAQASAGKIPNDIAKFVLNTWYNRVPKSKSEEIVKTDIIDESELFD